LLENPNSNWYVTFEYRFIFGNEKTPFFKGFALPQEQKPLVVLGYKTKAKSSLATIEFADIHWKRLDTHTMRDYPTWSKEHLDFVFSDIQFSKDLSLDETTIGQVNFSIENKSAYSYWDSLFHVRLIRGNSVAGISSIMIPQLRSGEKRAISFHWFGTLPAVSRVEIVPDINLFDPSSFMSL
jgi:hypothetical protein